MLLPDVLRQRAEREPDRLAYVFLDDSETEKATLTYRELHLRAMGVARRLLAHCAPGDRALLVFPQSLDFVVAYFGCLYAGVVAVPVAPPRRNHVQDATHTIVRDCLPSAVLTVGAMVESTRAALGPVAEWIAVDDVPSADDVPPLPCTPETIAFLQYTSGSTSDPKGVVVSHGNLAANQEMIRDSMGHDEHSTVVGWTPFFHDQGLIGNVLQPLYVGATAVLLSPMTFVRRPMTWLSAISRYRARTSGGPNFAFDACVAWADRRAVPELDLSCWRVAFNGAEPIRHETLRRFAETFAPSGFDAAALYPCYGLAEATLMVTASRKGRGARTVEADVAALSQGRYVPAPGRTLVGSGIVDDDVRIVDPDTRLPCAPHEVGEIWVRGDHVAQGYWERPDVTEDTFRAELADQPGRHYLRTGDLGVVVDGELYVVGRRKDLVIIRGRNHYPQDIEHTVGSSHEALQPSGCAAFSVSGMDGERLIVVGEIRREERLRADAADVAASVREAVMREHAVSVGDLVLTLPGQLRKTTSGKIMRAAARERYLAAGFPVWATAAD